MWPPLFRGTLLDAEGADGQDDYVGGRVWPPLFRGPLLDAEDFDDQDNYNHNDDDHVVDNHDDDASTSDDDPDADNSGDNTSASEREGLDHPRVDIGIGSLGSAVDPRPVGAVFDKLLLDRLLRSSPSLAEAGLMLKEALL